MPNPGKADSPFSSQGKLRGDEEEADVEEAAGVEEEDKEADIEEGEEAVVDEDEGEEAADVEEEEKEVVEVEFRRRAEKLPRVSSDEGAVKEKG